MRLSDPADTVFVMEPLTDRDRIVLDVARETRPGGHREQAARDRLDVGATRYGQLLDQVLDLPAALEHDPVLVNRLRRLRAQRAARRAAWRRAA